jgi:glycosyltransferase involved in cell wall biosynthesis
MKVLVVEPFGHGAGQPSMHCKYLSHALVSAGAEVTLVTFDGFLDNWIERDEKVRHVSLLSRLGILSVLLRLIQRLERFAILGLFVAVLDTFSTLVLAFRQSKKEGCKLIHVVDATFSPLSTLVFASFVKNYSLVLNIHGASREVSSETMKEEIRTSLRSHNPLRCARLSLWLAYSRLISATEDFLYRRSAVKNRTSFVCYTEQVRESYRHRPFYRRIECITLAVTEICQPLPQQQARQHLNLAQEGTIFLLFGINDISKNYEVLFQAIQNLSQDIRILRAGKTVCNEPKTDTKRLAEKYGWSKNTIVIDQYIPEEELVYYFSATDALVLSYTKEFLGQSVNLLHGCQFSLPVIASDVGQLGEQVKNYKLGLTFIPEDPLSLREAITSFLNLGTGEKLVIKRNLHEFAIANSWEQYTKRYMDIYQALLNNDNAHED